MMNDNHPGDALELHALGALERDEAQAVEDHVANCSECARRLGAAEQAVAALDDMTVPKIEAPPELATRIANAGDTVVPLRARRAVPRLSTWGVLAACLIALPVGVTGTREVAKDRATIAADDRAFAAIAASHFAHTTLTKTVAGAPTAKVLWGKDPQWLYVIVDSATCACDVIALTPAGERDLGSPEPRGSTATLFVPDAPEVSSIELRSGERVLETAKHP
jgi:hypothetical protein